MRIWILKHFAQLLFWLYELLDTIFEMFEVLAGITYIDQEAEQSLLEIFLESSTVTRAFLLICIVAVFVAAVSVIAAIVKNIINAQVDFTDRAPVKAE